MRNIFYKQAKHCPHMLPHHHPDFVLEWTYQDMQPNNFNNDGAWDILPENQFMKLLAKNEELLKIKIEEIRQRDLEISQRFK